MELYLMRAEIVVELEKIAVLISVLTPIARILQEGVTHVNRVISSTTLTSLTMSDVHSALHAQAFYPSLVRV
jgi:PIN domain nuclease of toxin-antitoxin system